MRHTGEPTGIQRKWWGKVTNSDDQQGNPKGRREGAEITVTNRGDPKGNPSGPIYGGRATDPSVTVGKDPYKQN